MHLIFFFHFCIMFCYCTLCLLFSVFSTTWTCRRIRIQKEKYEVCRFRWWWRNIFLLMQVNKSKWHNQEELWRFGITFTKMADAASEHPSRLQTLDWDAAGDPHHPVRRSEEWGEWWELRLKLCWTWSIWNSQRSTASWSSMFLFIILLLNYIFIVYMYPLWDK